MQFIYTNYLWSISCLLLVHPYNHITFNISKVIVAFNDYLPVAYWLSVAGTLSQSTTRVDNKIPFSVFDPRPTEVERR